MYEQWCPPRAWDQQSVLIPCNFSYQFLNPFAATANLPRVSPPRRPPPRGKIRQYNFTWKPPSGLAPSVQCECLSFAVPFVGDVLSVKPISRSSCGRQVPSRLKPSEASWKGERQHLPLQSKQFVDYV